MLYGQDDCYEDWADLRVLARERRKSSKDRTCDACFQPIPKGDTYTHEFAILDGEARFEDYHVSQCPPHPRTEQA